MNVVEVKQENFVTNFWIVGTRPHISAWPQVMDQRTLWHITLCGNTKKHASGFGQCVKRIWRSHSVSPMKSQSWLTRVAPLWWSHQAD